MLILTIWLCYLINGIQAQDVVMTLSTEVAMSGTEACVELSVENFTNVRSFDFIFNVNNTMGNATFSRVANFNLPALSAANFTDLGFFGVTVDWDATDPNVGATVPDGTVIAELCFDVTGNFGDVIEVFIISNNQAIFESTDGTTELLGIINGSISITGMPLEVVENNILPEDCNGIGPNGHVEITVSGGTMPYTFEWSDLSPFEDLTDVEAGDYSVTVTDSSMPPSEVILSFTVPDLTTPPTIDIGTNNLITCRDEIITLGGSNTSMGDEFEYQWLSPGVTFVSGQNDPMAEIDQAGIYTFRVTNTQTGCTAEDMIEVTEDKTPPNIDAGMDQSLTCDKGGLILTASNDEGLPNLSAEWIAIGGQINEVIDDFSINVLLSGTYSVVLTNEDNGCTSEDEVEISQPVIPTIESDGDTPSLNCDTPEVDITAITTDPDFSVNWTTTSGQIVSGEDTNVVTVSSPGIYISTVIDPSNNCSAILEVEVIGNTDEPIVNAGDDATFTCNEPIVTLSGTTDTNDGTIEWTDENGNFISNELSFDVNRAGDYILNVTNEFGCLRTDDLTVVADTMSPVANAGQDFEAGCIDAAGIALDGTGSAMGNEFNYMWSTSNGTLLDGFNTLTPTIGTPGIYDLVVTNSNNGCTSLSTVTVSLQSDLPLADAGPDFSVCENSANLSGNIADIVTGVWTTTGTAGIDDPNAENIAITNLREGENVFVWTLSTPECANYSSDTVRVILETAPNAVEDMRSIPLEENTLSFNVLENDNTANNDGVFVSFETSDPNFMDLGEGLFSYTFPSDSTNTFTFSYTVCSEVCPDLCDVASVTLERMEPALEPVELDGLPNVITPNGDGLNDALIFDILLTNPQDFPNPELVIFNRWGDVVFEQRPYRNDWQGTNQTGGDLPEGTYYFIHRLDLTNANTLSGDITIIRD